MRIQKIFSSILLLATSVSVFAAEQTDPVSIIHPDWEYTYYNNYYRGGNSPVYQKCGFTDESEIDGNKYWTFSLLTETDNKGVTKDINKPLAYMREENGEVYMRLHPSSPGYTGSYHHPDTYGYKDRDLMIYDFNLKAGEEYQIGEPDTYPVYGTVPWEPRDPEILFTWLQKHIFDHYSYMILWNDGRLSVSDVKDDETSGRRVWFIHQKCTYPMQIQWSYRKDQLLDELDTDFSKTHIRTFRFVEGIGSLKGFLPFPGLFPPSLNLGGLMESPREGAAYLCEITDKATGETIYKDERRPDQDNSVDEIGAEGENVGAEYYTLQGIRVLNPEPGEICIVRRGAKVTKEVIAR